MKTRFLFILLSITAQAQTMQDAEAMRAAARQRAFDRGFISKQRAEETKAAYMAPMYPQDPLAAPPASHHYEQVMQAGKYHDRRGMTNANATHSADPALYSQSLAEARQIYPALQSPVSRMSQRCAYLQRWAEAASLPLAADARRPLLLAHIAALEITGTMAQDSQALSPAPPPSMTPAELRAHTEKATNRLLPGTDLNKIQSIEIRGSTAFTENGQTYNIRQHITGNGFIIENGIQRLHIPATGDRITLPNGMDSNIRRSGDRLEFLKP